MAKTTARISPRRGLALDLPAEELGPDYWSVGSNVAFRPFAERAGTYEQEPTNPSVELRSLLYGYLNGAHRWVYHGKNKSYSVTGTTHTDVTKGGGTLSTVTAANQWSVGLFNSFAYANNAVDTPMYWNGDTGTDFAELPGWIAGSTCATLRGFGNFLFALNLTTAGGVLPDQYRWSSAAPAGSMPTTWTPSTTNDAGAKQLSDTAGGIIDGQPLGNGLALYKARNAYVVEYRPDNEVFQHRLLPIARGVLARNCIASYKGRHFLVTGDGDFILTDGLSYESIGENRILRFVFGQLDQASYGAVFCVPYFRRGEIWVCFPSAGNSFCDLAAVWSAKDNTWAVRDLPLVSCAAAGVVAFTALAEDWNSDGGAWDSDTSLWNEQAAVAAEEKLLLGKPNDASPASSLFLEVDKGLTANGSAITARVGKYSMDLGDPVRVKTVKSVHPYLVADVGTQISVRVGSQMSPADPITWSAPVVYTAGSSSWADVFSSGRYISVEFTSTVSAPWTLPSFGVEFEYRGFF